MLSGPSDFLRQKLTMLSDRRGGTAHLRVIVSVEFSRRGASRKQIELAAQEGRVLLVSFGLDTLVVGDAAVGGATDGRYLLGFGRDLGSAVTPTIEPGLCLVLRHFLDGGVEGSFPVVARDSLPPLVAPARAVLLHDGIVRPEGLFPCRTPATLVYAPSYRLRGRWVIRRLTTVEHLRLRQLPLSMDPLLSGLNSLHALPFEDSLSPEVFTSVFRQLWGATEGGCRVGNGGREEEDTTDGNDAEEESWSCLAVEHSRFEREIRVAARTWSATTRHRFGIGTPSQADLNVSLDGRTAKGEVSINSRANSCGGDDSMTASMPISAWPDTSSHPSSANGWELDLSLMSEKQDGSLLTDEDTVTSVASEATLCRGRQNWDVDVEEHELGPSLPSNPGPPFKVGDVILCDIPGQLWGMDPMVNWLQRGFIMQAEHPNYKIRLERGATVWTNTSESWLQPRPLQGVGTDLAEDADDPFSDLRGDSSLRFGSYGIHLDAQRDSLTKVAEAKEFAKAVKADDAEVPKQLWNNRIRCPAGVSVELRDVALEGFRKLGHKWFLRGLIRDCVRFVRASYGTSWRRPRHTKDGELTMLGKDREAIASVIWHSVNTSWFDYHAGSTLIHFRFPAMYQEMARDGVKVFFEKPGPTTREAQPKIRDPKIREMAKEKIFKVLKRRYLRTLGIKIKSMIKYFAVPKGEDDIRMVYDATANHLNECVWVPTFWLPTIESLIRTLDQNSWMTDRDVGDMFLNFKLHWTVGPYTGVDLSPIYENDEEPGPRWAVWDRNLMGFAASPYSSVKMALVVEEVCRGNRREEGVGLDGKELNPFQWRVIRLNLPGTKDYDPCLPWISKVRADGRIACDVSSFVDDERVGGPDEDLTWQASHKLASTQSYLGMQDAARKARLCSQQPGAWAGAIVHIVPELGVCVLTSLEKWLKLKTILKKWSGRIKCHQGEDKLQLDHKELLSDRGFLVYVTRTYPSMVPYLKGFHLTIEMWRGGRDAEGWKLRERDLDTVASEQSFDTVGGQEDPGPGRNEDEDMAGINHRIDVKRGKVGVHAPADGLTTPVPRFKDDVAALLRLTDFDLPPLRVVRPTQVVQVFYGFGDASGKQFGSTLSENYNCRGHLSGPAHGSDRIRFRIGLWSPEVEEESSNYKELRNLVESIGDEARAGRLRDCELFVFTDNSTAEGCFHRGTSKSVHLHALVLELRTLEMIYGMTLHVVHISGKRMIAQGTDGCSRGSLMEGVMAGQDMLSFIDLSRTAIERHPPILKWVRSWTGRPGLAPLPAEGWFEEGHGMVGGCLDGRGVWIPSHEPKNGLHLWSPPPAVADVALEELLKARHKRTDTFHVVLIPRLMTPRWRRLFAKACDFTFVVSPGLGASNEPLFWWKWEGTCVRCSLKVKAMEGIFCGNFSSSRDSWPPCRNAWHAECYTSLGELPKFPTIAIEDELGNPWHKEEERQMRLGQGVDGAHMCIPFQCEFCWLRNLQGRDAVLGLDDAYLACIKRSNLDAMLGKSALTIQNHARETRVSIRNAQLINKTPSYHPRGPFPLSDCVGMGLAVDMQLKSLVAKGRIRDHVQFSTLRRLRATYTKNWESSPLGVAEGASFSRGFGRVRTTTCPSQSEWFSDFLRGMEYRMGSQAQPNHGLLIGAIIRLLEIIDEEAKEAARVDSIAEANELWKVGAYVCILTAGSLRGHEGFYLDLAGMRKHVAKGREGVIPEGLNKSTVLTEEDCLRLPHVTICLLGKFKGETGVDHHLITVANETSSGLRPRWWVEKLLEVCNYEGRFTGPAFATPEGDLASSPDYDAVFRKYLKVVQDESDLIPADHDIDSFYSTFRTPRKTSTTRIERSGFGNQFVDQMNRWRTQERSEGRAPRRRMNAHYAEALLLMPTTWMASYVL